MLNGDDIYVEADVVVEVFEEAVRQDVAFGLTEWVELDLQ